MKKAMVVIEEKLHGSSAYSSSGTGKSEKNGSALPGRQVSSDEQALEPLGEQLLQVHDSILVECKNEDAEKVAEILQSTMENIAPDLGVRLQVDVHVGDNWGEV